MSALIVDPLPLNVEEVTKTGVYQITLLEGESPRLLIYSNGQWLSLESQAIPPDLTKGKICHRVKVATPVTTLRDFATLIGAVSLCFGPVLVQTAPTPLLWQVGVAMSALGGLLLGARAIPALKK